MGYFQLTAVLEEKTIDKEKEINIKTQKYSVPDLKLISVSQKPIQTVNS